MRDLVKVSDIMSSNQIVCLKDLEQFASKTLSKLTSDFYKSGATGELTLADNEAAFQRYKILPRVLKGVKTVSLATSIQGHPISMPICIAPTALQCMAHPDGEIATVKAAMGFNTLMCLSVMSTISLEEVARVDTDDKGLRWILIYVFTDRELTQKIIRRAELNGYKAIVIVVDSPEHGMRYANVRNGLFIPHSKVANFKEEDFEQVSEHLPAKDSVIDPYFDKLIDNSLSWDTIKWVKSITTLTVILKGILTAEDALMAVEHGVDGIWVSNHGGRQLDTVPATIDTLHEVVRAVDTGKTEVYMDGGVRYGTDVLKALALGARAVFVGRPVLWGLAYDGEKGVMLMLDLLRKELELAMALSGCKDVLDMPKGILDRKTSLYSKL